MRGEHKGLSISPFEDSLPSVVAAAHELKAPLGLIRQLSLMLQEEDIDDVDSKRMLEQISLTSERALRLTGDLTKAVRLRDAMFQLEPINPKQLCEDVVHEMTPLFKAHGRRLNLTRQLHSSLIIGNRDLLHRILVNFSDNALNYAEDSQLVEIYIKSLNHGDIIRLGVRDYGPALSIGSFKEAKSRLMAPKIMSTRPQSSGLGIYIASLFAEAMNGQIGITRHRDGVTFYVDLKSSSQMSLL